MSPLVIDASVAVARIRNEPAHDAIDRVLGNHRGALLVPAFFWLEVVNVLSRRYRHPGAEILEALRDLDDLGIESIEVDGPARLAVIDLAERFGLSAYDAAYLALAESADAQLMTLDRALAAAAGERALLIGPHGRISELPEPYEREPTWASWRGAASYLAELRRRADDARDIYELSAALADPSNQERIPWETVKQQSNR